MYTEEKQPSDDSHYQCKSKGIVRDEVCFYVTNHLRDLMLHVYLYTLSSLLQSLVEGEFSRFINRAIEFSERVKSPCFESFSLLTEMEGQFE